jgi:hypothetical protein
MRIGRGAAHGFRWAANRRYAGVARWNGLCSWSWWMQSGGENGIWVGRLRRGGHGSQNTGWRRGSSPEAARRCASLRRALFATTVPVKMDGGCELLNWLLRYRKARRDGAPGEGPAKTWGPKVQGKSPASSGGDFARLDCRHSSRCGHHILLGRPIVHGRGCTYHPRHCRLDDPVALMWTLRMLAKT